MIKGQGTIHTHDQCQVHGFDNITIIMQDVTIGEAE
jgi:hypothetical protein